MTNAVKTARIEWVALSLVMIQPVVEGVAPRKRFSSVIEQEMIRLYGAIQLSSEIHSISLLNLDSAHGPGCPP